MVLPADTSSRCETNRKSATCCYWRRSHSQNRPLHRHEPLLGNKKFLTLTETTKQDLFGGFSEALPPKSFQDAILVTRRLGVSFLWIDSLCIFQDSKDDWRRESAQMGDVYSRARCMIAATGARDAFAGLLLQRNPLMIPPFPIETSWQCSDLEPGETRQEHWLLAIYDYDTILSNNPLLLRSWVVQERILSKRMVHFSSSQIFWECSLKTASELHPDHITINPDRATTAMKDVLEGRATPNCQVWKSMLIGYTGCRLTFSSDRLAALQGIAQAFGSDGLSGRYLAGVWERDFLQQLSWRAMQS